MTQSPRSTDAVLGGGYSPKRTAKYVQARAIADKLEISENWSREELYNILNVAGYYWQSDSKRWEQNTTGPNPASSTIKVRATAAADEISKVVDDMVRVYTQILDYKLLQRTEPHPRRPPEQLDSSVYLVFIPND